MKKLFVVLVAIFTLLNVAKAQLAVQPITVSQLQLIQNMLGGAGATISNITYNGSGVPVLWNNIGTFNTGGFQTSLGITNGLILGTGGVTGAIGPNNSMSFTLPVSPSSPDLSDSDLIALVPGSMLHDAAILEFDFKLITDTFRIRYVFASEEYPEFVNTQFDDVFGFFVSGPNPSGGGMYNKKNIALLPLSQDPVTVNTVNYGTTNSGPCMNCSYYVDNTGGITLQADGFTTVLTASIPVVPCATYHFKVAIADRGDRAYDSWVFLEAAPPPSGSGNLAGTTTVCQGQQNVLYSLPNLPFFTQYNWTLPSGATGLSDSSSILVNYGNTAQSGLITISGTSICGTDTLMSFPIIVNPKPATPAIAINGDTLMSNTLTGNQWYSQNGILVGDTNQMYIASAYGNYYDIVTSNGCTSDSSIHINYVYVGIEENKIEKTTLTLIPNPAKDNLTVETNAKNNLKSNLEIVNLLGQSVYNYSFNRKATIDVSRFAKGIYFLKLNTDKETIVKKFVKE